MRFWLKRGVDGFRFDALNHSMFDTGLTDNPPVTDNRTRTAPEIKKLFERGGGSAEVVDLFRTAHRLMARNLVEPDARRMTAAAGNGHRGGHFVYGRNRLACRRCETPVRRTVNGVPPRSTYWCPTCQPS